MKYIIGVTDIPGELWRIRSRAYTEAAALKCVGADGEYVVRINDDGSSVALWRWDTSIGTWAGAEWS